MEDDRGMTPLHHAIAHPRCVSLLLDQGCEVDTLDKTGRTPLFFALKHGFTESSRILLAKGITCIVFAFYARSREMERIRETRT